MRGAAFLKKPLPATELEAAMALRSTTTKDDLSTVWWRDCEHFEGAPRERLSSVFAEMLSKLGALRG